jgi:hypothetical protein
VSLNRPKSARVSCDDRHDLGDAPVEIAVDDDVILFRPMAHLLHRFRHALGDDPGACPTLSAICHCRRRLKE